MYEHRGWPTTSATVVPLCFAQWYCIYKPTHRAAPHAADHHHRLSVSLSLGAEGVSSEAATTGGLVASGEGTCNELLGPKPSELLRLAVSGGGGLPADPAPDAVTGVGVAGG